MQWLTTGRLKKTNKQKKATRNKKFTKDMYYISAEEALVRYVYRWKTRGEIF